MNLLETPVETNDDALRNELLAKWKDKPLEDVLKAKVESDLYIKTLEKQKDELRSDYLKQRDELVAKAKFEDLLDRFEKSNTTPVTPPEVNEKNESPFKPEDIDARVRALLEETRQTERKVANFNKVQEKLKERYGNNYAQHLRDTGLPEKQINEIAMESPEALFRLIGLDNDHRETFQAPPRSNQRPDQFSPKVNKRDWNYYQELTKTNPRLYLDPKIAVQMHNDAIALGDAFGMPKD